jgi:prepilin-type N-terminal cleavage/methylation domain-containing protein
MQSRARYRRAGFTLVELVAVVVIVGLIATVTVTRLDFLVPKYRLRGAARDVGSVLGLGKAHAAANGKDVYFEIDLSQGRFWLLAPFPKLEATDAGRLVVEARPLEYQPIVDRTLPDGTQITDVILGDRDKTNSGLARVRLSAFGASSHVIVNLRNEEGKEISVKLNGFTGMISYADGRQEAEELLEDPGN